MIPRLAVLSVAALLAGCATMEPHYQRPADAVPAALPTGPAYPAPGSGGAWAEIGWSDFFADPRLKQVIGAALANNRDLRVAVANIASARAQYRIQRSELVPQILAGGDANYGRTSRNASSIDGVQGQRINEESYALSVGVTSYEVDLWGRIRSLNKEALESYLATEEAARTTQISVISETASAWLTLASDRTTLEVSRRTLASAQASLDVTRRRLEGGIVSALDVRQAETLVAQAQARIAELTTAIAQDQNALALLVGAPVAEALLPQALDDRVTLAALPGELSSAVLLTRPDVLEAEHRLRAANFDIGAARAAFFPTISLTGSGGVSSTQLSSLFKGGATNWSFGPSISFPLLDGGRLRAQLDQSKAEKSIQVATYERTVQTAFREVADALARRGTIDAQVAANVALVNAAQGALDIATRRYERGSDTFFNVLDAQRTLYSAQEALVAVRLTRADNLVTLYQVLGGGLRS